MIVQLVEGVKELFLRALLVAQKLDVVNQQHVRLAVALLKLLHTFGADAGDHLVHETFARSVDNPHGAKFIDQLTADGVHQMCFTHAHAAVKK